MCEQVRHDRGAAAAIGRELSGADFGRNQKYVRQECLTQKNACKKTTNGEVVERKRFP